MNRRPGCILVDSIVFFAVMPGHDGWMHDSLGAQTR
jgi:hypothetical protein